MKKLILLLSLFSTVAFGVDRIIKAPSGKLVLDASTTVQSNKQLNVTGAISTKRTTADDVGGNLTIGDGTSAWDIIGNQVSGGDLLFKNPADETVMYFSATGGNVGIGTTNPAQKVDVVGSIKATSFTSTNIGTSISMATGGAQALVNASEAPNGLILIHARGNTDAGYYANYYAYSAGGLWTTVASVLSHAQISWVNNGANLELHNDGAVTQSFTWSWTRLNK